MAGASWRAMHIAKTNMFLVAIDRYERSAAYDGNCAEVVAKPTTSIAFDRCEHGRSTVTSKGFRRSPRCPVASAPRLDDAVRAAHALHGEPRRGEG